MGAEDRSYLDQRVAEFVDECIGSNLDLLISMDMRGDGLSRELLESARASVNGSPVLTAAKRVSECLKPGDRVLMLTGFIVPPWNVGETDGLIGTVVLSRALEVAFGVQPIIVCEPEIHPPLDAGFRTAGLQVYYDLDAAAGLPHSVVLLPYPKDPSEALRAAQELAVEINPAACIAVERPGRNSNGHYHFGQGRNVTDWIAPIDELYEAVQHQGALTIAVGDLGNELGMGAVSEVARRETPAGANCGCGCGGGTVCEIPADVTVACSVSDWGAYAIAAAVAYVSGNAFSYPDGRFYRRILEATVVGGCIDGTATYAIPHIDGIREDYNTRLVDMLRDVIEYPADPTRGAKFRAIREHRIRDR